MSPVPATDSPAPTTPAADLARAHGAGRAHGDATRERLLRSSLRLFAKQGYAATSVRELAQAAGVNVAAISYYFGDKVGLYRAVFFEPVGDGPDTLAGLADPQLTLDEALAAFFAHFLGSKGVGLDEDGRLCVRLRMREMLEPTGLWAQEVEQSIRPMHQALVALIGRHLGLAQPDDDVHRLAVSITGLGVHLHLGRDVIDRVAPQLNASADAGWQWARCLQQQALAMVDAERRRRAALPAARTGPAAPTDPAAPDAALGRSRARPQSPPRAKPCA